MCMISADLENPINSTPRASPSPLAPNILALAGNGKAKTKIPAKPKTVSKGKGKSKAANENGDPGPSTRKTRNNRGGRHGKGQAP